MAKQLPNWAKAGPVVAIVIVFGVVVGYAAIGAAIDLFGLRPLAVGGRTQAAPESRSPEVVASSDTDLGVEPTRICQQFLADRNVTELSYYSAVGDHVLANLQPLVPSSASRAWTVSALGEPCAASDTWIARVLLPPQWSGPAELTLPAAQGAQFQLPDERHVLLNPVLNGNYLSASFVATLLSADGQALSAPVLMPTGQNRGFHGRLYTPRQQALGSFHVWLEAGGTWQGHTVSWVGVTDFAGSAPRDVGIFPSSYHCPEGECVSFELESVQYSANGPDELTLTWSRSPGGGAVAHYTLEGGRYVLRSGEEPSN